MPLGGRGRRRRVAAVRRQGVAGIVYGAPRKPARRGAARNRSGVGDDGRVSGPGGRPAAVAGDPVLKERLGTPKALQILQRLADAPASPTAADARAALDRLQEPARLPRMRMAPDQPAEGR